MDTPHAAGLQRGKDTIGTDDFAAQTARREFDIMKLSLPCRQLIKDYDRFNFIGFLQVLWILPMLLASKEDTIGTDDFNIDPNDNTTN